jgi:outer membrane biosynthesis protein TonB
MFRLRVTMLAAATVAAALAVHRPDLGPPTTWSGDEAALAAAWTVAVVCSAYLALVAGVCVFAMRTHRARLARRASGFAPQFVRRLVEVALVGTLSVAPAVPALASGPAVTADQPVVRTTPSTPVVPARPDAPVVQTRPSTPVVPTRPDAPVVRTRPAPAPTSTPPRRARPAPPTSAPPPVRTIPAPSPVRPAPPLRALHPSERPPSQSPPPSASPTVRTHVVRPGDNLWTIARGELQRGGAADPGDAVTARYLRQVIASNRASLRSGNPSLIFPGEVVALPEPA